MYALNLQGNILWHVHSHIPNIVFKIKLLTFGRFQCNLIANKIGCKIRSFCLRAHSTWHLFMSARCKKIIIFLYWILDLQIWYRLHNKNCVLHLTCYIKITLFCSEEQLLLLIKHILHKDACIRILTGQSNTCSLSCLIPMLPHNNYHGIDVMWDLTIFISFKWISWLSCIELHKAHITEEYVYECVFENIVMIFFFKWQGRLNVKNTKMVNFIYM